MNINNIILSLGNHNIEIDGLSLLLMDDNFAKKVSCRLMPTKTMNNGQSRPIPLPLKPLLLWSEADYDSIGDYTQAQAESRVLELLGSDQQQSITALLAYK